MSEQPSEERTEDPSFQKLKKARERGDIPRSQAFLQLIGTASGFATLWFFKDVIAARLEALNQDLLGSDGLSLTVVAFLARDVIILMSLPVILGSVAATIAGSFLVNKGFVFSMEKIKPNIKNISFSSYRERTFSANGLALLIQISIVAIALSILFYFVVLYFAPDYFRLFACGLSCGLSFITLVGGVYVTASLFIVLVVALVDLRVQQRLYLKKQRSTKTEAKQELKEEMGEPHIRRERRLQHQEAAGGASLVDRVNRTSFVLHYSDEFAVAVGYVNLEGRERFFTVDGGAAGAASQIIVAAGHYNKPLLSAPQHLAAALVRYGNEREVLDPQLIDGLRALVRQAQQQASGSDR
ncbi:MAG: EscU/YscU/HrcU family type III secretion system export apparatus switch protein [Pseudomonadota bacterium]